MIITKFSEYITESKQVAKSLLSANKISKEQYEQSLSLDPSPQKKYAGWIAKMLAISSTEDVSRIKSYVEEFNVYLNKHKVAQDKRDINVFKSVKDLADYVEELNSNPSSMSLSDLEKKYDVILDTPDLLITCPHTHEASHYLAKNYYNFTKEFGGHSKSSENNKAASAWCTTIGNDTHFNNYYLRQNVTLYYILVKPGKMRNALHDNRLAMVACAVLPDGQKDWYDGHDNQLISKENKPRLDKFLKITGLG